MKVDFISQFGASKAVTEAIIMLPDIFISTDYATKTATEFAKEFNQPVFMLDYFYQLTGQKNAFSPAEPDRPFELLQKMMGEDFTSIFQQCLRAIQGEYPAIKSLSVIGFCFGGRLAYLSGLEPMVKNIVSFYGAGAHQPNYIDGKTPIEALIAARSGDAELRVISFYGTQDTTIPESDRDLTQKSLVQAKIAYTARRYAAGHAYFQPGRDNYDEAASQSSWQDLKELFKP